MGRFFPCSLVKNNALCWRHTVALLTSSISVLIPSLHG